MSGVVRILLAVVVGALCGCTQQPGLDRRSFAGMPLSEVRELLGEPDRTEEIRKTSEHIFGPIENVWAQVEMGDTIVTWVYEDRHGRKELYFAEGDTEIAAEFFWYDDESKNPVF